jgi:hypothetical protein
MKTTLTIPRALCGKLFSLREEFGVKVTYVKTIYTYKEDRTTAGLYTPDKVEVGIEFEDAGKLCALGIALAKEAETQNYQAPETFEIKTSEDVLRPSHSGKYAVAIKRVNDGKVFFLKSVHTSERLVFTEELKDTNFLRTRLGAMMFADVICASTSDPNQEILLYFFSEEEGKIDKTKVLKISRLDS